MPEARISPRVIFRGRLILRNACVAGATENGWSKLAEVPVPSFHRHRLALPEAATATSHGFLDSLVHQPVHGRPHFGKLVEADLASAPSLHIMRAGTYHEKSIQVLAGCVQRAWRARERERTNSQAL